MAPDLMWGINQLFYSLAGVRAEPTNRWYSLNRIVSIITILFGLVFLYLGFIAPDPSLPLSEFIQRLEVTMTPVMQDH